MCVDRADVEKLARMIKILSFLIQTKVYLFWKNKLEPCVPPNMFCAMMYPHEDHGAPRVSARMLSLFRVLLQPKGESREHVWSVIDVWKSLHYGVQVDAVFEGCCGHGVLNANFHVLNFQQTFTIVSS
jgi:hypothetical protein